MCRFCAANHTWFYTNSINSHSWYKIDMFPIKASGNLLFFLSFRRYDVILPSCPAGTSTCSFCDSDILALSMKRLHWMERAWQMLKFLCLRLVMGGRTSSSPALLKPVSADPSLLALIGPADPLSPWNMTAAVHHLSCYFSPWLALHLNFAWWCQIQSFLVFWLHQLLADMNTQDCYMQTLIPQIFSQLCMSLGTFWVDNFSAWLINIVVHNASLMQHPMFEANSCFYSSFHCCFQSPEQVISRIYLLSF